MLQVHYQLQQGLVLLPSEGAVLLEPFPVPQGLLVEPPEGQEAQVSQVPPEPERESGPPEGLSCESRTVSV